MRKLSYRKFIETFSLPILVFFQSLACPVDDYRYFMLLFSFTTFIAIIVSITREEKDETNK